jgi:biotin carboxylase
VTPSVLIVTMGTDAVAPAGMPHELKRAGFDVALLAPRDSFAAHTAFAGRIGHFPDGVTLYQWVQALLGAMRAAAPALIFPGDEIALRTLIRHVLDPPAGLLPQTRDEIAIAVRRSLGDSATWIDSTDKSRRFDVARRARVPIAEGDVADSEDAAVAIARSLGYPVILRPSIGSGGRGTARCDSDASVRAAMRVAPRTDAGLPGAAPRYVVQRFIDGRIVNRASVAWNGDEIAGITRRRLETHSRPVGPASVVEFVGAPAVRDAMRRLCAALDLHGLVGGQFMRDPRTGSPILIEVHRRMLPVTHSGSIVGVDLAGALHAALAGRKWDGPVDLPQGPGLRLALFPQECYRDPGSRWLRTLPSDAPWDDPKLFAAMLRLGESGAVLAPRTADIK